MDWLANGNRAKARVRGWVREFGLDEQVEARSLSIMTRSRPSAVYACIVRLWGPGPTPRQGMGAHGVASAGPPSRALSVSNQKPVPFRQLPTSPDVAAIRAKTS